MTVNDGYDKDRIPKGQSFNIDGDESLQIDHYLSSFDPEHSLRLAFKGSFGTRNS